MTKFHGFLTASASLILLAGQATQVAAQESAFSDLRINRAVERQLYNSDEGRFHKIDAEANQGTVTLSGSVDNLLARSSAERITESIRGVQRVNNDVEVSASGREDRGIGNDVQAVISASPTTRDLGIRVAVSDGLVVLTGTAESQQQRQLIEKMASGIVGVRRIQNNIKISYRNESPDQQIKSDIIARMQGSNWIDESNVKVDVNGGAVTLSGKVGSVAERRFASSVAWVGGTTAVNADQLRVLPERGIIKRPTRTTSDQQIANATRLALKYCPEVKAENVGVAVLKGVVTLTGTVDTYSAKLAADDDVREVYGVRGLRNTLRVRTKEAQTDDEMEDAIRAALLRDPYVDRSDIDVRVSNAHAHLYGVVDTKAERGRATKAVSNVNGLVFVTNHLNVRSSQAKKTDWEIQNDVEEQIWWSPFVDSGEVTVTVDDGVVTLNGTVHTWAERNAASKNASDGGAKRVNNRLRVEFDPSLEDILQ